jgi:hypothetical protein
MLKKNYSAPSGPSDYSRILSAILPHYYPYLRGFVIAPEIWSADKRKSDFVVSKVNIRNRTLPYGHHIVLLMCECKNKTAISWWNLAKDQLWAQADSLKHGNGRLWVIGQIGFEICFFRFDILNYEYSEWFTNFSPLNLRNFSPAPRALEWGFK